MHQIDNGIKENFFRWDGRLNRKRYLKRLLALMGIGVTLYILLFIALLASDALSARNAAEEVNVASGVFTLASLPITVSSYMLMIRRLHDIGLSGYFVLLALVPLVSLGLILYLLFKNGTAGDNAYGPDPLAGAAPAPDPYENPYARTTDTDTPTDIAPPKNPQN